MRQRLIDPAHRLFCSATVPFGRCLLSDHRGVGLRSGALFRELPEFKKPMGLFAEYATINLITYWLLNRLREFTYRNSHFESAVTSGRRRQRA